MIRTRLVRSLATAFVVALSLVAGRTAVRSATSADPLPAPVSAAAVAGVPLGGAGPAVPVQTGTIEGVVTRRERPNRRVVNRYAGSGNAAARALQDVPMVAYLEGALGSAQAGSAEVAQQDTAFVPGVLVVPVGTAVAFPNRDPFFHNVFSFSPAKRFDLGRYPQGESKTVEFDRAGAVKVYCEVHQFMRAGVIAVENPYHAVVADDGSFRIAGVPAGRHRLVVWDIELRPQELDVNVTAGAVTRVQVSMQ